MILEQRQIFLDPWMECHKIPVITFYQFENGVLLAIFNTFTKKPKKYICIKSSELPKKVRGPSAIYSDRYTIKNTR